MTLVIALKVGDGVVLGADSASTIMNGSEYHNSYFNAEKLYNLRKGLPIGALTFGLGGLKGRSIGSLSKDLRQRFTDENLAEWYLDPDSYTMAQVADGVKRFFFDELYVPEYGAGPAHHDMGLFVAGYSANADVPEVWRVIIDGGTCTVDPTSLASNPSGGIWWDGVSEALYRLVRGWSETTLLRLQQAGLPPKDALNLLDAVQPLLHDTMPIQDAIDLVHYLMDVTIGFVRFSPGEAIVAQPIDSAAITKHEGFRWVRRKHYYTQALNVV